MKDRSAAWYEAWRGSWSVIYFGCIGMGFEDDEPHMTGNPRRAQVPEPFRVMLTAHRSLPPVGFLILMATLGLISFAAGLVFLLLGAWPVLGFFGLDLALVYVAFRMNYRSGRLYETIVITQGETTMTRVHPSGRCEVHPFATAWVRLRLDQGLDGRTTLSLNHHQRRLVFGLFLTDDERCDLAEALQRALVDARGGIRY